MAREAHLFPSEIGKEGFQEYFLVAAEEGGVRLGPQDRIYLPSSCPHAMTCYEDSE